MKKTFLLMTCHNEISHEMMNVMKILRHVKISSHVSPRGSQEAFVLIAHCRSLAQPQNHQEFFSEIAIQRDEYENHELGIADSDELRHVREETHPGVHDRHGRDRVVELIVNCYDEECR